MNISEKTIYAKSLIFATFANICNISIEYSLEYCEININFINLCY